MYFNSCTYPHSAITLFFFFIVIIILDIEKVAHTYKSVFYLNNNYETSMSNKWDRLLLGSFGVKYGWCPAKQPGNYTKRGSFKLPVLIKVHLTPTFVIHPNISHCNSKFFCEKNLDFVESLTFYALWSHAQFDTWLRVSTGSLGRKKV